MKPTLHRVLLAGILGGCGAAGDDVTTALPGVETLSIAAPAGGVSGAAEPSALWLATRHTADTLNGMIAGVVGQMQAALAGPVSPPLSPLTFRVVAARGAGGVAFELDARPRSAGDDAYVPVAKGVASDDGRSGEVHLDLATLRRLDPGAPAGGDALGVAYDVEPAETHLALVLDEAHYAYVARGTGGELAFDDGPDGRIRSGWLASGAGRAVVAGAGDESDPIVPVVLECWDEQFRRVFHAGPDGTDGDPAACADVP